MTTDWPKDQKSIGTEQSGHLKSFDLINSVLLKRLCIVSLGKPVREEIFHP